MKRMFKKVIFGTIALFLAISLVSCNKDDLIDVGKKTEITVNLKDMDGSPLSGWVVYGYNQFWWNDGKPNTTSVGVKQSATDANGKATFVLEDIHIKDSQEVYRFVVYYTITRTNVLGKEVTSETLQKVVAVTVKEGQNQTIDIQL